jgi:hypothetical protein
VACGQVNYKQSFCMRTWLVSHIGRVPNWKALYRIHRSSPHTIHIPWMSFLILAPSDVFPSSFLENICCVLSLPRMLRMSHFTAQRQLVASVHVHTNYGDPLPIIILIPVGSSVVGPNILYIVFSNTLVGILPSWFKDKSRHVVPQTMCLIFCVMLFKD